MDMVGHGYVTLPSRPVGAVLGDLNVSTGAWSTGHSAIHSLGHGPLWLSLWMSGKLGELRVETLPVLLESLLRDQVHFIDWLLTWWCGWK